MAAKWHLTPDTEDISKHDWPLQRSFERFFGTIQGAGIYFDPVTLTRDNTSTQATEGFYTPMPSLKTPTKYVEEFFANQEKMETGIEISGCMGVVRPWKRIARKETILRNGIQSG